MTELLHIYRKRTGLISSSVAYKELKEITTVVQEKGDD